MGAIHTFVYNKENVSEFDTVLEKRIDEYEESINVWANVNMDGPKDEIETIFNRIDTHPLVKKGIMDETKRPKIQDFEDAIVLQVYSLDNNVGFEFDLIKIILGKRYLVTFQERAGDSFDEIRYRIREKKGLIRERGVDYLLYKLLESIVDEYIELVDDLQNHEYIPTKALLDWNPNPESMRKLEKMNQRLFEIKKSIRPLIESARIIEKGMSGLINKKNKKFFLDLVQQCQFLIDSIESFEHRLESSINLFFTMQGHHMNQVMKTLTVVSSIFIPLTFLAGIYGMNFQYMPELDDHYSYFIVLGIMGAIAFGMVLYLRMRNWF